MPQLFTSHTINEHTQSLADHLPNGKGFIAKNQDGTNFRRFLRGLAFELQRIESTFIYTTQQYDPQTTTDFITEWESAVGIPDDCFPGTEDLQTRRKHVVVKLLSSGANTAQDFIDIAAFLGFDITISYLDEVEFYPPYDVPITLITGVPESRFIWIVTGAGVVPNVPPYDVPFSLSSGTSVIQCLFNKLKPAHTRIIYRNE